MGKQKGERSKNRPSSSSLAASLLPSGAVSVGFGGYLGSSKIEQPSSSEESVPFVEVDNEVAQHMKRLGRKDPTTKIKALTSLCLLFGKRPGDEIVQIIPQWAFEYKRLLLDYNREVRRAAHEAMTSLVRNVRKGLVPHLKSLMGPWWFSQFDPIFEVSQAAKKSMETAFPAPERRLDALMLCVNDIFIYLDENLKLTPQSMSDKATAMDELEDMHHRVISSSLLAVATLLDVLLGPRNLESDSISSEQKLASKARMATISCAEKLFITHNYFLDLFKSKSSAIRSATYSVLTSYSKQLPQAFSDENIKSISGMILGIFQEKDAFCHSAMWDMILIFIRKFQNCWSFVNFQKIVLNRFWTFLRHGCYGSQQISYPALVLFLESIPPNVTGGEQFVLDFFENMWVGRTPLLSGEESLGFFKAFKECFLWVLSNASRYSNSGEAVNPLSIKLINNILVTLVWHDYLFSVNLKNKDSPLEEKLKKSMEKNSYCYPSSYVEELGKCIVGILADLSNRELYLLSVFSKSFQKDSLEIFQNEEFKLNFQEHVERLSKFCHLLNESAWQRGQKWPFHYFAGPLFVKCFKVIITMDSPYAVKFLCTLFEIFGPVMLLPCLHFCNEDQLSINLDDISNETSEMYFMQAFRDDFVPLCLARHSPSSTEKLKLLIYSIHSHFLSDQWSFILTCAIDPHNYASVDTEVLNVLIGKVKERIRKMDKEENHTTGYLPEHWQHQLLDAAAIFVATHTHSSTHSVQFLCSVLGGARENDKTCFLSQAAVIKTFEEIFRRLVSFISISPLKWAKLSSSLLLSSTVIGANENLPTTSDVLKMAQFAFEVLEGSIFHISMLGDNSMLLSCTLAAMFTIYLEYKMSSSISEEIEEESEEKLALGRRMQSLFNNKDTLIWENLSSSNLSTLRNVLVHTLRYAIFETSKLSSEKISSLCCEWVLHLLEVTCYDQAELQIYLDQFLSEQNSWSFWVLPPKLVESESAIILKEKEHEAIEVLKHNQFVAFVDKLIAKLGFPKVIAGVISPTGHVKDASSSYSRAWLAAELLCTWKWQGGNVLDSFLPSLSEYVTHDSSHPNGHVIFTIVGILLDGIFVNGVKSMWISLDTCIASEEEIENIKEPFLRALISLLSTLYVKFKVWRKFEAIEIFRNVVDRLFINGSVNKTCLRMFPYVMGVLVEPLLLQSSEFDESGKDVVLAHWKDDLVIENVLKWLDASLLFPPLGLGYDEESDLGGWVQLISSCYPLRTTHMLGISKVDTVRDISHLENSLLLKLFQNQRSGYNASVVPLSAQMILSKLTVVSVGYCWKYFSEDDWHFVLDSMQNWIELSVLMVEEMVEKIDEMAMSSTSNSSQALFIEKLDLAVKALDPSKINISSNALLILSLCSQLFDLQEVGSVEVLQSIKHGKWSEIKDRVLENVLRLFFATGVSEAIANSFGSKASLIVASNRVAYSPFWARVSSFVISAPKSVKTMSVQSMELWGLSKGPTSSIYAILFSSKPIVSLQNAAYRLISSEPLCRTSLLKENYLVEDVHIIADTSQNKFETSSSDSVSIMDEISYLIQKPASDLLELDLVSLDRANVYLAWAILLSYLHSLPPSSLAREALIQFVQESIGSSILDCIFQNIPLKQLSINSKKKDVLCPEAHIAANAAKNIIDSGTTVLDLGTLFPIGNEQMASFAGSIYGMMIWLLPSYVRNWFTSIRDRGLSLSIESFTKVWCSPSLVSFELSQVKETVVADENFSVSVNKSAYELVATYKKEETGMDLVISLPNCYPLRPVDVDCTRSLGISEVKKRKWLLSLTAFVRNQNGAIGEAIKTWKNNLDKEFLGVEECPICYSIIHTANHSLPRLACKTCKHKFHSVCLYKWFSTSHKSTCPLCQMPF